jgi:ABC-type nitrate/sulfonate/bicarbonate transport system permease component
MYAGILTLAVLGYGLNRVFLSVEHVTLRWYVDRGPE